MTDLHSEALSGSRSARLEGVIRDLLVQAPELEAAAVVSFDGLPMAAALPPSMDEDRVAAMSAALLSLGERAAEGLGRGQLSQVYIEGDEGTVFLVSADDEAVLVAVAAKGAKAGMMLFEVRRAAGVVAGVLHAAEPAQLVATPEPVILVPVQASGEVVPPPASFAPTTPAPWGVPAAALPASADPGPARPAYDALVQAAHQAPDGLPHLLQQEAPQSQAPGYQLPHDVPAYEVAAYEVAAYDLPRDDLPRDDRLRDDLPLYDLPQYDLPQYDLPQYDLPHYDVPVVDLPVQQAPVRYAQPAADAPAPEPVWPTHAPTGSVMPGGGVPPSTWS